LTTNEGLAIGGVVIGGGILIYMLSSSQKKLLASNSTTGLAGVGGLLGGIGTFIKDIGGSGSAGGRPPAAYGTLSGPNGVSPVDTATSNYLADATAASDDQPGVVGFGGWDD
jgi:hypothetical protein